MENQDKSVTTLKSLMTDTDRHKLKELSISLHKKEQDFITYKDTLANILRRSYELTAIIQKLHRRTEQEIKDCEALITEIKTVLGETAPNPLKDPS